MIMRFLAALTVLLVLCGGAAASERQPTVGELEGELFCPACKTTLDQSNAPIADQMRQFIAARIAAGDTKSEIKERLVARFGPAVLAAPPKRGFNLLAWLLPLAGLSIGALAAGILVWRWTRPRREEAPAWSQNGRARVEPELERRLDEELARLD